MFVVFLMVFRAWATGDWRPWADDQLLNWIMLLVVADRLLRGDLWSYAPRHHEGEGL